MQPLRRERSEARALMYAARRHAIRRQDVHGLMKVAHGSRREPCWASGGAATSLRVISPASRILCRQQRWPLQTCSPCSNFFLLTVVRCSSRLLEGAASLFGQGISETDTGEPVFALNFRGFGHRLDRSQAKAGMTFSAKWRMERSRTSVGTSGICMRSTISVGSSSAMRVWMLSLAASGSPMM